MFTLPCKGNDLIDSDAIANLVHTTMMLFVCSPYAERHYKDIYDLMHNVAHEGWRPDFQSGTEPLVPNLDILIRQCTSDDLDDRPEFDRIMSDLGRGVRGEVMALQNPPQSPTEEVATTLAPEGGDNGEVEMVGMEASNLEA